MFHSDLARFWSRLLLLLRLLHSESAPESGLAPRSYPHEGIMERGAPADRVGDIPLESGIACPLVIAARRCRNAAAEAVDHEDRLGVDEVGHMGLEPAGAIVRGDLDLLPVEDPELGRLAAIDPERIFRHEFVEIRVVL